MEKLQVKDQEVSGLLKVAIICHFRGIDVQVLIFGLKMTFLPFSAEIFLLETSFFPFSAILNNPP
jgi:hypothetical protein